MTTVALARVYQQSFNAHPNTTLAFTGGCLNALGDAIAQITENTVLRKDREQYPRYDAARTLRFFCYGFTISPLLGRWNRYLEYRFPLRVGRGKSQVSAKALWKRVAYDQLLMAPTGLAVFLGSMGLMEAHPIDEIQAKYTDLFIPALIANWKMWPIAQLINFRFMPLAYRVPFQSTCGIFWTLYLSLLNSAEDQKQRNMALNRKAA